MVEHPEQAWNKLQPCNDSRGDKIDEPQLPNQYLHDRQLSHDLPKQNDYS